MLKNTVKQIDVANSLKQVRDPEISMDIVEIGLIYGIDIKDNSIDIVMSLTSPTCPYADFLLSDVKEVIKKDFNKDCHIQVTFKPMWNLSMCSEETIFNLELTDEQIKDSIRAAEEYEQEGVADYNFIY